MMMTSCSGNKVNTGSLDGEKGRRPALHGLVQYVRAAEGAIGTTLRVADDRQGEQWRHRRAAPRADSPVLLWASLPLLRRGLGGEGAVQALAIRGGEPVDQVAYDFTRRR